MTIKQLQKKFKHHIDDYDPKNIVYTIITEGKWLDEKLVPKGYGVDKISSYGLINQPKLHTYIQDIYKKKD